jgi:hypothetical protein
MSYPEYHAVKWRYVGCYMSRHVTATSCTWSAATQDILFAALAELHRVSCRESRGWHNCLSSCTFRLMCTLLLYLTPGRKSSDDSGVGLCEGVLSTVPLAVVLLLATSQQ